MEKEKLPVPGEIYQHFKNKLYQIITIAIHSETGEKMVVYQALYGEFRTYVRPLAMFISEVDHLKYPEVHQKFRFEIMKREEIIREEEPAHQIEKQDNTTTEVKTEMISEMTAEMIPQMATDQDVPEGSHEINASEGQVNPILLEFLDANKYEQKLTILNYNKSKIDDKLIDAMAASLDCTVEDGEIEDRMRGLLFCLQTMVRFESNRLR